MLNHKDPMLPAEPSVTNHLAWVNAVLGLQRTLMAAERTAVTFIAFGFTIAQIFQSMIPMVPAPLRRLAPDAPQELGLVMIGAGIGTLALFTWQYRRAIAYLRTESFAAISLPPNKAIHRATCATAYTTMGFGVICFATVLVSY